MAIIMGGAPAETQTGQFSTKYTQHEEILIKNKLKNRDSEFLKTVVRNQLQLLSTQSKNVPQTSNNPGALRGLSFISFRSSDAF